MYMYVAFWGLLFTVDFISVHDIQRYVWQQWNDAFEQHLFALFWPETAQYTTLQEEAGIEN